MPPPDYNKQCNEWTSLSLYRTALKTDPAIKLSTWASHSNFDYARLVLKNAEVRKQNDSSPLHAGMVGLGNVEDRRTATRGADYLVGMLEFCVGAACRHVAWLASAPRS
jgi:hypothetical protein